MNKFIYKILCVVTVVSLGWAGSVSAAVNKEVPPKEWTNWLKSLQREMISRGISQQTISAAYDGKNYYHKAPEVVAKDEKQTEFVLTTCDYVNRLANADRVKMAREKHKMLQKKYKKLEKKYNVPLSYLTAFWAVETNFGSNKGKYHLIDSLTNLSYKNRRSKFFKNELYNVLKIMDKTHLSEDKMLGSWAGAMGHFQFMPSTYNSYAVDYDGDDIPDIWNSFDDALASAANYLTKLGWDKKGKWGTRISLPWNFDFKHVGRQHSKTVAEWRKLGVKTFSGKKLPFDENIKASVILPDGRKGPAFLVLPNFKRVMIWNRSDNYALAIVTLADYIENPKTKWTPIKAQEQYVVNSDEIMKIQRFHNKFSRNKLKVDGKLGPKTREGIKLLQRKAKLPEDGYPDFRLINKINNYNPKLGFAVPVQQKKAKKK